MRWSATGICGVVVAGALCAGGLAQAAGRIPLLVSDATGLDEPWPLVGGVPFAAGILADPAAVRLVDEHGTGVPAQIDRTAVWRDGTVRWLMVSAVAPASGRYFLEFGPGATPTPAEGGVTLSATAEGYSVDTQAAHFLIPRDGLGIEQAQVAGVGELWHDGAAAVYVVDSLGRRAVCAGADANVRWQVAVQGPIRVVLRGDADYVTDGGERVARATVWYWFFRGRTDVKVVHTVVLTEDTDKLWMREIGWRLPLDLGGNVRATFDSSRTADETVWSSPVGAGEVLSAVQEDFPHFLERRSGFVLRRLGPGAAEDLLTGDALGEWLDVAGADRGLTVVVRDLAEQFPKALEASSDAVTIKLWTTVKNRELDFRLSSLIPNYFSAWADRLPNEGKVFRRQPSNATGAAKTHEFWLRPHAGPLDTAALCRYGRAVDERILLLPAPEWTCAACVLHPSAFQHQDLDRFPRAEAMMSDFFDRSVLGLRVFPMTGFIGWGCNPFLQYQRTEDGRWYAGAYRLQYLIEYNLRRNAWLMFARTADRKYYDYVSRFDWFAADWSMHHETVGKKVRGGFARQGNYHYPVFWGDRSEVLYTECSGTDLFNWYAAYYLTGDLRSLDVVHEYRDAVGQQWRDAVEGQSFVATGAAFMTLRLLVQLYMEDWDVEFGEMCRVWAHGMLDPASPNGITDKQPYGFLYKVSRNLCSTLEYWWATQDPLARACYLKAVDYNRRFARVSAPISYQNGQGAFYAQAHRWTASPMLLRTAHSLFRAGLTEFESAPSLAEKLAPGLDNLERLPYRGPHLNLHPLYSMPIIMATLEDESGPAEPAALVAKDESDTTCWAVFRKAAGRQLTIEVAYDARIEEGLDPVILGPDGDELSGARITVEKMHYWRSASGRVDYTPGRGQPWRASANIELPAAWPAGDYRVGAHGQGRLTVVGCDAPKAVLECPDGLFFGAGGVYGARLYFDVPVDRDTLSFYCGRPVAVCRGDGTVVTRASATGQVSVPTNGSGGLWSVSATFPTYFRLEGIPPVVALSPTLHFLPTRVGQPSSRPRRLDPSTRFVGAVVGRGRHLPGRTTIQFPRGAARDDGSYDNFPGYEGTIEFYFRPNWSTRELTYEDNLVYRTFVSSRGTRFYYRYGKAHMPATAYAFVDLLIPGSGDGYSNDYGTALRLYLQEGRWIHLAGTWRIARDGGGPVGGEFSIFLDGKRQDRGRWYPHELEAAKPPFTIREVEEQLNIGPMDGTIDELRISDCVRYTDDFEPPTRSLDPDAQTTALFRFEDSDAGWLRGEQ